MMINAIHQAKFGKVAQPARTKPEITRAIAGKGVMLSPERLRNQSVVAQPTKRKRAQYFKEYRQRPKLCSHCGKEI